MTVQGNCHCLGKCGCHNISVFKTIFQLGFILFSDASSGVARYRARRAQKLADPSRFNTQPVTVDELEDAGRGIGGSVRPSASAANLSIGTGGVFSVPLLFCLA